MRRSNDQKVVPFDWKPSFKSCPCRNPTIWWEKTSRQKKFHFWPRLSISIKWSVYTLVYTFTENSQESTTGWIIDPSASIWAYLQVKHMKIIKHGLRVPEWTPGDKTSVMETSKKNRQHFESSWQNPKSKKCSSELNIGRSETNEDSVRITMTFCAQCAEN